MSGDHAAQENVFVQICAASIRPDGAAVCGEFADFVRNRLRHDHDMREIEHFVLVENAFLNLAFGDVIDRDVRMVQRFVTAVTGAVVIVSFGDVRFALMLQKRQIARIDGGENRNFRFDRFRLGEDFRIRADVGAEEFCGFRTFRRSAVMNAAQAEFADFHHAGTPGLPLPEQNSAQAASE